MGLERTLDTVVGLEALYHAPNRHRHLAQLPSNQDTHAVSSHTPPFLTPNPRGSWSQADCIHQRVRMPLPQDSTPRRHPHVAQASTEAEWGKQDSGKAAGPWHSARARDRGQRWRGRTCSSRERKNLGSCSMLSSRRKRRRSGRSPNHKVRAPDGRA